MKAFELLNPTSLADAISLLPDREGDDSSRLLAGGQDLLPELKEHLVEPERLVNLRDVPGLGELTWNADGSLSLGAMVTVQQVADDPGIRERLTLLAEAAASVGSPQIRAMGTVGGNLNQRPRCWYYRLESAPCLKKGGTECFSYAGRNKYNAILGGGPSYIVHPSDLAPALVALDARVTLAGPGGERVLPLREFFTLPSSGNILRETVLRPDEVLTRVDVPAPAAGMRSTYLKFKERSSYDWALSSVALCLWQDAGAIQRARLVLGGVAPIPWPCDGAEEAIAGRANDGEAARLAADAALAGAEPLSENGYKVPLTRGLITRALQKLA